MEIVSVVNEGLGHSSHVIGLGDGTALVIDPARLPGRQRHYDDVPPLARLSAAEAAGHVQRGAVLVDARPLSDFADGHPEGALSNVLRPVFASWLGWLVELDRPLVFVLDESQDRAELVRQCLTVGHEHLLGELDGGVTAWVDAGHPRAAIPLIEPTAMAATVLDVRQAAEWATGHLPSARHVELGALPDTDVVAEPVTVMCGHGERAMTAASLLAARGHREVSVLAGGPTDWTNATSSHLVTEP